MKNIAILCFFFLFATCRPPGDKDQPAPRWTSSDPLIINQKARLQKYMHGNWVANPSFEKGYTMIVDSTTHVVNVEGWELSKNVYYYSPSDTNSILHGGKDSLLSFIKIEQEQADETADRGIGVLSEYIKVLPGNYRLSFRLKLQNIRNPRSRLGMDLHDAVNVRLIYYDKNKVEISGDQNHGAITYAIDNSFKSLSFANITAIDSMPWLTAYGRTHSFPFPDGDLPDDVRYVRIFIGLKGNGTMFLDKVSFEYTSQNISLYGRLQPYFDSVFTKPSVLNPQPQKLEVLESINYMNAGLPIILIPQNADIITVNAAQLFEKEILSLVSELDSNVDMSETLITSSINKEELNERTVFSIGKTTIQKKYESLMPYQKISHSDEGYYLYTNPDLPNVVFMKGETEKGDYRAVQTALQLFDSQKTVFHNAKIVDYPSFQSRSLIQSCDSHDELLHNLFSLKVNRLYAAANLLDKRSALETLLLEGGLFSKSLDIDLNGLKRLGVTGVYVLDTIARSGDDFEIGEALNDQLNKKKIELLYHPLWSSNESMSLHDCQPVSYPEKIVYAGASSDGSNTDEVCSWHFKKHIDAQVYRSDKSMQLDSEMFGYRGAKNTEVLKLPVKSFLEPYLPAGDGDMDYAGWIIDYPVRSEADLFRMATAVDFMWNKNAYHPELSIYKLLVNAYGTKNAQLILQLDAKYFECFKELALAESDPNATKYTKKLRILLQEADLIFDSIQTDDHPGLVEFYYSKYKELVAEFKRHDLSDLAQSLDTLLDKTY